MTIRILLRALPLLLVAILALASFVEDGPDERRAEIARLEARRLALIAEGVNCPELRGNQPASACGTARPITNPAAEH